MGLFLKNSIWNCSAAGHACNSVAGFFLSLAYRITFKMKCYARIACKTLPWVAQT